MVYIDWQDMSGEGEPSPQEAINAITQVMGDNGLHAVVKEYNGVHEYEKYYCIYIARTPITLENIGDKAIEWVVTVYKSGSMYDVFHHVDGKARPIATTTSIKGVLSALGLQQ
jgi:hypothetical protein